MNIRHDCPVCGKETSRKEDLKRHVKVVHKCEVRQKAFGDHQLLKHMTAAYSESME